MTDGFKFIPRMPKSPAPGELAGEAEGMEVTVATVLAFGEDGLAKPLEQGFSLACESRSAVGAQCSTAHAIVNSEADLPVSMVVPMIRCDEASASVTTVPRSPVEGERDGDGGEGDPPKAADAKATRSLVVCLLGSDRWWGRGYLIGRSVIDLDKALAQGTFVWYRLQASDMSPAGILLLRVIKKPTEVEFALTKAGWANRIAALCERQPDRALLTQKSTPVVNPEAHRRRVLQSAQQGQQGRSTPPGSPIAKLKKAGKYTPYDWVRAQQSGDLHGGSASGSPSAPGSGSVSPTDAAATATSAATGRPISPQTGNLAATLITLGENKPRPTSPREDGFARPRSRSRSTSRSSSSLRPTSADSTPVTERALTGDQRRSSLTIPSSSAIAEAAAAPPEPDPVTAAINVWEVSPGIAGSDFNERFQQAIDGIRQLSIREIPDVNDRIRRHALLISLYKDFLHTAKTYGRIIIEERFLPKSLKSIKPLPLGGIAGGQKFIVNSVLFKFAVDKSKMFGDDAPAAKVAGHELKSIISVYNTQLPIGVPLIALIDFRGFRLIAESVIPIQGDVTLVTGSRDAGNSVAKENSKHAKHVMTQLAKSLNLRPYDHGSGANRTRVYTCVDTEGHEGLDGRFYLLDLSRTFPPEAPPNPELRCGYLYQLLRPELLKRFNKPVCSDAFSNFISPEDADELNSAVLEATEYLHKKAIPEFTAALVDLVADAQVTGDLLEFQLKTEMHSWGINLRHLGRVYENLGLMIKSDATDYKKVVVYNAKVLVFIEMAARCINANLNAQLRAEMERWMVPMDAPFTAIYVETFKKLAFSTPGSKEFWGEVLQAIADKFKVVVHNDDTVGVLCAFHPSTFGKDVQRSIASGKIMLLKKLQKLSGFKLKRAVMSFILEKSENFETAMPKLYQGDAKCMKEVVKDMNIVNFAEGYVLRMMSAESTADPGYTQARALSKFEKALSVNPNNTATLRNLAQMLIRESSDKTRPQYLGNLKIRDISKAYQYFQQALSAGEDDAETHFQWAEFLYRLLGESVLAMEEVLKALDIAPGHVRALKLASELCMDFGLTALSETLATRSDQMQAVHLSKSPGISSISPVSPRK